MLTGVTTEQCLRLECGTLLCDRRSWGSVEEREFVKSGSHSLENRKGESRNVYQHVTDDHSRLILNFSGLVIRTCSRLPL